MIKSVTSDGSDDQRIIIDAGNGGQSSTRGAYIALSGNEASSEAGKVIYQTGNVSGSSHVFRISGGSDALTIDSSQDATFASWIAITEGLIVNESGGDNDVRMESQNNDNMFRLDASTDRIGIGTATPKETFEVAGHIANWRLYSTSGVSNGALSFNSYYDGSDWVHDDNTKVSMNMYLSDDRNNLEFSVRAGDAAAGSGSTHMVISSAGLVGIGRSSNIHEKLHVDGMICSTASSATASTAGSQRAVMDLTSNAARIGHFRGSNGAGNGSVQFFVDSDEKMRISSLGEVFINREASPSGMLNINTANGRYGMMVDDTYGNDALCLFRDNGTGIGSITIVGGNTAFNTTSDYRLKENEVTLANGLTRLNQLKPYNFNFIAHPDIVQDGFFAHEVAEVVPVAVTGEKDAVDDDGEIEPQQLDNSKLVPLLVKAIQELSYKNDELETRIAELENA